MYDIYMSSTTLQTFDLEAFNSRSFKVTYIADFKSAYISFIIGPRGLQCETNLQEIMCCESSDMVRFDLGPLLQGQTRVAKLKSAYNLLIIGRRSLGW